MVGEGIDYKAVLADLKARRSALDQAIAAIEAILGEVPTSLVNGGSISQEIQPDTFVGLNIADATAKYLKMVGRPARTTETITEALQRGGLNVSRASVGTVLLRNHNRNEGEVVRVGRGLWGLAEWYPQRPRQQGQSTKRREADEERGEPKEEES